MKDDIVLRVSGLSKRYCHDLRRSLAYGVADIAREIWPRRRPPPLRRGEFLALDNVSFALRRGEAMAVVGGNGAGKSTLLRTLLGLLKPDAGEVRVYGRVEAILDLGAGVQDLLSGRENLHLRAALQGLSRRETLDMVDGAIAFADLGPFIDDAVQSYSTGMKARLGYAASAHLRPDILLIDEALAVGDLAFRRKCVSHMRRFVEGGGALLFVSHNSHQVQSVCRTGILLEKGQVAFAGSAVETLSVMHDRLPVASGTATITACPPEPCRIDAVEIAGTPIVTTGAALDVTMRCHVDAPVRAWGSVSIWTDDRETCIVSTMTTVPVDLATGANVLRCCFPGLPLIAGSYRAEASLIDPETLLPLAQIGIHDGGIPFKVHGAPDAIRNMHIMRGQLIEVKACWATGGQETLSR